MSWSCKDWTFQLRWAFHCAIVERPDRPSSSRLLRVVWWCSLGSCIFPFLFLLLFSNVLDPKQAAGFIPGVVMNISNLRDLIVPKQKVIWHSSNDDYTSPSSSSAYKSATEDTIFLSIVLQKLKEWQRTPFAAVFHYSKIFHFFVVREHINHVAIIY